MRLKKYQYDDELNFLYRGSIFPNSDLRKKVQDGSFFAFEVGFVATKKVDITSPYKRPSGATTKAQRESGVSPIDVYTYSWVLDFPQRYIYTKWLKHWLVIQN